MQKIKSSPALLQSAEYERALCDLVIILAPFAPMFCLELWSALTSVQLKNSHYRTVSIFIPHSYYIIDVFTGSLCFGAIIPWSWWGLQREFGRQSESDTINRVIMWLFFLIKVRGRQVCQLKTQYNLSDLTQLQREEAVKLALGSPQMEGIELEDLRPLFRVLENYRAEVNFISIKKKLGDFDPSNSDDEWKLIFKNNKIRKKSLYLS